MPRRKEKRKKEVAPTDSVPESPPKKAKKAAAPTAGRPNMPLSSTSIKKTIKGTNWHSPPPPLSRGPHQAAQEVKKEGKNKEEDDAEEDDEGDEDEEEVGEQPQQIPRKAGLSSREREQASWVFYGITNPRYSRYNPSLYKPKSNTYHNSHPNEEPPKATASKLFGPTTIEIDAEKYAQFQKNCGMMTDESGKMTYPVLKTIIGKVVDGPSALRAMYIKRHVVMENVGKKTLDEPTMNTAIMLYYRYKLKGLLWPRDGTVTYWYDGGQVGGPKEYDPEEHRKLAEKWGSVWVEGLSVPFYVMPQL